MRVCVCLNTQLCLVHQLSLTGVSLSADRSAAAQPTPPQELARTREELGAAEQAHVGATAELGAARDECGHLRRALSPRGCGAGGRGAQAAAPTNQPTRPPTCSRRAQLTDEQSRASRLRVELASLSSSRAKEVDAKGQVGGAAASLGWVLHSE